MVLSDEERRKVEGSQFEAIGASIRASMRRYPRCRVASCDCDEFGGEWEPGCNCPGHWAALDTEFGESNWSFADAVASNEVGKPVRAEAS